jgi:hypothetical protein
MISGDFDDDFIRDKLTKLTQIYKRTAASFTIRGAFRKAGFTLDFTKKPYQLVFNEDVL